MSMIAILSWAATLIDLVQKAGAAAPDVIRAYNSIKNIMAKDPSLVTQEELDAIIQENVDAFNRIQRPLDPEQD